jgi:uncharacterized protein (DUF433 family)
VANYSRRHYRLIHGDRDTPEAVQERLRYRQAAELGHADMLQRFPELTPENAEKAMHYQEARIQYHLKRLGSA